MKKKTVRKKRSSAKKPQQTFKNRITLIFTLSIILILLAANIPVTTALGVQGNKTVLGENENREEEHKAEEQNKEAEKKQEEQRKEETKKQEEAKKEVEKPQVQNISNSNNPPHIIKTNPETPRAETNMKTQRIRKQETEIETNEKQKIKTKVEDDGTAKIEAEDSGLKLKYVVEKDVVKLKIENEKGEQENATEKEIDDLNNELEHELENEGIEIASDAGIIKLARNKVTASTKFPLSVNTITKQLVVTTPQGQKVVAVLPDKAVENLINTGVVNKIDGSPATDSGQLENINSDIKLEIKDGEAVYKIKADKTKKLLGVIPITTPITAFVSAESGIPVATEQSLLSKIISSISF